MAAFSKLSGTTSKCAFAIATCLSAYALMLSLASSQHSTLFSNKHVNKPGEPLYRFHKSINLETLSRIMRICRIIIPSTHSKEFVMIVLSMISLVIRTWVDIWVISNNTDIESALISGSACDFIFSLHKFIMSIPLLSLMNAAIKYSLDNLKIRFFERLCFRFQHLLLRDRRLYQLVHFKNNGLDLCQILVNDLFSFSSIFVDIFANVSKPTMTIIVCFFRLVKSAGLFMPSMMIIYLLVSGLIVTRLRRPLMVLTRSEYNKLDQVVNLINKIILNSEQIAFYGGEQREALFLKSLTKSYGKQYKSTCLFRFGMTVLDQAFAKYFATVAGFTLASRSFIYSTVPFEKSNNIEILHSRRLKQYYENCRVLIKMATSVGRLVVCSSEVTKLITYSNRISEVYEALLSIKPSSALTSYRRENQGKTSKHIAIKDKFISFEDVPIITPDGTILIESINLEVPQGVNVLVVGPNGCGKSSMFRILGELWPLQRGRIIKPPRQKLFYIPQTPYMPDGSLRDQIIYPHIQEDAEIMKSNIDKQLLSLLERVKLLYLLERGGWNFCCDWNNELSGGEKQRLAMARVLYHRPQFAILDECTSAVSIDIEDEIYTYCRKEGITLLTISHRHTLRKFHNYQLTLALDGSYTYNPIDQNSI